MNLKLVESLAEIINNLTPEEKQALGIMVNFIDDNNKSENQSWHEFIENTYGSIKDETFTRHPQGNFEQRELF
ncbi:MAG: hypothetical protein F6K48_01600 [Okeania sp. SIO3H1]|uniref:hypothetical protein n=1 Tax=Okeania sp. SIO1I7 TaxID=2607772 RepID=UPI0013CCF7D8|nr:hypothetical protein [Okeania sp. SIO1I7]NEN87682.1 hypothetical protein [Okeania sp. SIO3H1]NET28524.1 hypothetical protein [Okeania sp. SIO1I7]